MSSLEHSLTESSTAIVESVFSEAAEIVASLDQPASPQMSAQNEQLAAPLKHEIVPKQNLNAELDKPSHDDIADVHASVEVDDRVTFDDLKLPAEICEALKSSGYIHPTAIQAATIPAMLEGRDVLGQAQTGTGKTAAFALPLLTRVNVENPATQVLVLAPTRELAIQVSESFHRYGQHMRGLRVAPIYGGQAYATQIHQLNRGVHIVVGTPGRVMDHMRENRLRVDTLNCLVLDEADEMLRMGFAEDVQWILDQTPTSRQIALFSATMPPAIREIADKHLNDPHVVTIDSQQRTAETIRQRFVLVEHRSKFDALLRILDAEPYDGMIIFVKTKMATVELADNLTAMGRVSVALNGDIPQAQRERTIEQLKQGVFNILVATDVAARGLDVQRITHVINYDLPMDSEAYVHRIGRTGRAGRSGEAIVFVAPRQRGFLREIDRAAGQMIEPMAIPTAKEINAMRTKRFKDRIVEVVQQSESRPQQLELFEQLIEQCASENSLPVNKVAAALAVLSHGDKPFFLEDDSKRRGRKDVFDSAERPERERSPRDRNDRERGDRERGDRDRVRHERGGDRAGAERSVADRPSTDRESDRPFRSDGDAPRPRRARENRDTDRLPLVTPNASYEMERFRVEVGNTHGVRPGNLVGAIANEAGLDAAHIGQIAIFDDYSTVDLPSGMPREVFKTLGRAWVVGRQLRISKLSDHASVRGDRKSKSKKLATK